MFINSTNDSGLIHSPTALTLFTLNVTEITFRGQLCLVMHSKHRNGNHCLFYDLHNNTIPVHKWFCLYNIKTNLYALAGIRAVSETEVLPSLHSYVKCQFNDFPFFQYLAISCQSTHCIKPNRRALPNRRTFILHMFNKILPYAWS